MEQAKYFFSFLPNDLPTYLPTYLPNEKKSVVLDYFSHLSGKTSTKLSVGECYLLTSRKKTLYLWLNST